jgi:hypothetical protein
MKVMVCRDSDAFDVGVVTVAKGQVCSCYLGNTDEVTDLKAIFCLLKYCFYPAMLGAMVG